MIFFVSFKFRNYELGTDKVFWKLIYYFMISNLL